jgi:hypothetical protein
VVDVVVGAILVEVVLCAGGLVNEVVVWEGVVVVVLCAGGLVVVVLAVTGGVTDVVAVPECPLTVFGAEAVRVAGWGISAGVEGVCTSAAQSVNHVTLWSSAATWTSWSWGPPTKRRLTVSA